MTRMKNNHSFEALLALIPQTDMTDQNIARLFVLFVLEELVNSPRPTLGIFSDSMLTDTIFIQQQSLLENPNLKQIRSRVLHVIDGIEFRSCSGGEGAAIARLSVLEQATDAARNEAQGVKSASRGVR